MCRTPLTLSAPDCYDTWSGSAGDSRDSAGFQGFVTLTGTIKIYTVELPRVFYTPSVPA